MSLSPSYSPPASTAQGDPPKRKRIRLSLACNQCRKRKVRCDTTLPKCRNCILRNEHCETTDPRNPGKGISVRTLATKDAGYPASQWEESLHTHRPSPCKLTPGAGTPPDSSGISELSPGPHRMEQTARGRGPSWLERAYHESTIGNENNPLPASTPELVVNTDDTSHRVKYLGGSSIQCLCRYVDLHLAHKGLEPASSQFKHGMIQSEEVSLPLMPLMPFLPDLPPPDEMEAYVNCFFDRVWPLFPVVDRNVLQADIDGLRDHRQTHPEPLSSRLTPTNIPTLVMIYAVISIGVDEKKGRLSDLSTRFLTAAYSLYAHLIATPYMSSVQALMLLAIAFRGRVKDGQAWHMIGQAVRIAHSIGLHKQVAQRKDSGSEDRGGVTTGENKQPLDRRLWWSLYGLEKLMQLESGRPSVIDDRDDDQVPIVSISSACPATNYFTAWISLSRIMGQISELIYSRRPQSSLDLFSKTAKLDSALVEWERSLADKLKMGQGISALQAQAGHHQHLSNFLSLQFHYAHITLLRIAIIFPQSSYNLELSKHASVLPSHSRLLNGAAICASAARSTITQTLNLADLGVHSIILGATPPYLAAVVLALSILRQPARRLARADLELLKLATEHVEDYYLRWVPNREFILGLSLLREQVNAAFHQFGAAGTRQRESSAVPRSNRREGGAQDGHASNGAVYDGTIDEWPEELFEGLQFDELWDIMGSDLLMGNNQLSMD